ncbi:hypothetical protein N8J89_07765 [Crossiella sp. CA-258035]|uniref:hypothetical protein n=1 Tax=Crossiella sp. CA-258035 TaxID=2981138 RepID=UPI0024BC320F|nr:hypothetical protein [Crossiella sp. CA-258035]WHT20950.1 hypothetical protein N8J89_07765 [Crossiella sp. CA-258035]
MTYTDRESASVDIYDLLFVLFVGLKLSDHIAWSWFWVAFPLVLKVAIQVGALVVVKIADRRGW